MLSVKNNQSAIIEVDYIGNIYDKKTNLRLKRKK